MSFLLEEEEHATLADALAFIDTFPLDADDDAFDADIDASSSSDQSSMHATPSSPEPASDTTSSGADSGGEDERIAAARARNTRAVNQYRKRNKNEILRLRDEVRLLDARLGQLRQRQGETSRSSSVRGSEPGWELLVARSRATGRRSLRLQACSVGIDAAVAELRQLEKSEALNRKLKDALKKQRKVSSTLECLFRKEISKNVRGGSDDLCTAAVFSVLTLLVCLPPSQDLTFVVDMEKALQSKAPQRMDAPMLWDEAVVFSELSRYVIDSVYGSTPAMLSLVNKGDIDCAFNNTLVKHDMKAGKMLQFMANTPVFFTVGQLDATLWSYLGGSAVSMRDCDRGDGVLTLKFDCKLNDVRADGVSVGHKFVEPHRTVLVYSSLISPRGSGLLFRETMWMVMSDAAMSGCTTAPTLFQSMYRLHAELPRDASSSAPTPLRALDPGLGALHDFVMDRQGEKTRSFQVLLQDQLVGQAETPPPAFETFLASCSQVATAT